MTALCRDVRVQGTPGSVSESRPSRFRATRITLELGAAYVSRREWRLGTLPEKSESARCRIAIVIAAPTSDTRSLVRIRLRPAQGAFGTQSCETGSVEVVPVGHCPQVADSVLLPSLVILLPIGQTGWMVQLAASAVVLK